MLNDTLVTTTVPVDKYVANGSRSYCKCSKLAKIVVYKSTPTDTVHVHVVFSMLQGYIMDTYISHT